MTQPGCRRASRPGRRNRVCCCFESRGKPLKAAGLAGRLARKPVLVKWRSRIRCNHRWTAGSSLMLLLALACPTAAQPASRPASTAAAVEDVDDLAVGRRLLEGVRDYVFAFDDPAFYFFCRHVQRHAAETRGEDSDGTATPWKFLLERPGDYRGRIVVVEGLLQARYAYEVANRPDLGTLYQYELSQPGTGAICSVVAVDASGDIPLRARARAAGYFIKVRSYRATDGATGAGPLIVAPRLELIQPPPGLWEIGSTGWLAAAPLLCRGAAFWLVSATALLAFVWLLLRRRLRRTAPKADASATRPRGHKPPGSDDDFDWLTSDS